MLDVVLSSNIGDIKSYYPPMLNVVFNVNQCWMLYYPMLDIVFIIQCWLLYYTPMLDVVLSDVGSSNIGCCIIIQCWMLLGKYFNICYSVYSETFRYIPAVLLCC